MKIKKPDFFLETRLSVLLVVYNLISSSFEDKKWNSVKVIRWIQLYLDTLTKFKEPFPL
jgi:hypothetical protein